eukprot:1160971-Pelagomonas_calceolata.AAC.10
MVVAVERACAYIGNFFHRCSSSSTKEIVAAEPLACKASLGWHTGMVLAVVHTHTQSFFAGGYPPRAQRSWWPLSHWPTKQAVKKAWELQWQ